MPPHEARVFSEGALYWVQASGTGSAWSTASAATTALVGLVNAGTQITSAQRIATIMERGIPNHHKVIGKDAVQLTVEFLEAVTANNPALMVNTAAGASCPELHFELKMDATEMGAGSAIYKHLHYGALTDNQWTEQEEGNPCRQTWVFLMQTGPTASGYIG